MYHYPCASGGGCFQDIKTLSLLCKEHIDQAQDIGECFSKFVLVVVLQLVLFRAWKTYRAFRKFGNSEYQIELVGGEGPPPEIGPNRLFFKGGGGLPLPGIFNGTTLCIRYWNNMLSKGIKTYLPACKSIKLLQCLYGHLKFCSRKEQQPTWCHADIYSHKFWHPWFDPTTFVSFKCHYQT